MFIDRSIVINDSEYMGLYLYVVQCRGEYMGLYLYVVQCRGGYV